MKVVRETGSIDTWHRYYDLIRTIKTLQQCVTALVQIGSSIRRRGHELGDDFYGQDIDWHVSDIFRLLRDATVIKLADNCRGALPPLFPEESADDTLASGIRPLPKRD
jgi:hypothetical protein